MSARPTPAHLGADSYQHSDTRLPRVNRLDEAEQQLAVTVGTASRHVRATIAALLAGRFVDESRDAFDAFDALMVDKHGPAAGFDEWRDDRDRLGVTALDGWWDLLAGLVAIIADDGPPTRSYLLDLADAYVIDEPDLAVGLCTALAIEADEA